MMLMFGRRRQLFGATCIDTLTLFEARFDAVALSLIAADAAMPPPGHARFVVAAADILLRCCLILPCRYAAARH